MTATDGDGERSTGGIEVAVASNGECLGNVPGFCKVDLTGHYNNDGISEEGDFDDGNFDGGGWSFAGDTLPPAGPVTLLGIPFDFPSYIPGRKNTVEAVGQTLPLTPASTTRSSCWPPRTTAASSRTRRSTTRTGRSTCRCA